MSKKFIEGLEERENRAKTINGADVYKTTNSDLLDMFAKLGSMRHVDEEIIAEKFRKAFKENREAAIRLTFYSRDIYEGLGERRTSRILWETLSELDPESLKLNLELIPEFGRWDDLWYLLDTSIADDVEDVIVKQLQKDIQDMKDNKPISLAAKWIHKPNHRRLENRLKAESIAVKMGMTNHELQKTITKLRQHIGIVETLISENRFDEIDFEHIPSLAMNNYYRVFARKSTDNFIEFIQKVNDGTAKINASTLYPYNIVEKYQSEGGWFSHFAKEADPVLEAQWKALPDFVSGYEKDVLVIADTSGSMTGRPMDTALGLAVYFAERNTGVYKNTCMTFSENPKFIRFNDGDSLIDKLNTFESIIANTDIEKVFELILANAIENQLSNDELPESLFIITDGEFDSMVDIGNFNTWHWGSDLDEYNDTYKSFHEKIEEKYRENGYELPSIVYWNVNALTDTVAVDKDKENVILVSGQGTATFKSALQNIGETPYGAMINILNNERYDIVKIS